MKEMFATRYDQQFRPGFESVHPLNRFLDVNEFVFVALHHKPWALRLRIEASRESTDRRRDADQAINLRGNRRFHCNRRTE